MHVPGDKTTKSKMINGIEMNVVVVACIVIETDINSFMFRVWGELGIDLKTSH
jgi:hypothetical protein